MEENTKKCPFCGEEILAVAKKCKHCKQFLPNEVNDTNVNEFVENNLFRNPYAKAIAIGMAVLIFIIIGFSTSSSGPILSGCNFEKRTSTMYGNNIDFYICKNRPYTSMQIITDATGGNPHMYHHVYKRVYHNDNYYDDVPIASRIRDNGDYKCYSRITKDNISPCSMSQLEKLAVEAAEKLEENIENENKSENITNQNEIVLDLGDFVLNLSDINTKRYLKISVKIRLMDNKTEKQEKDYSNTTTAIEAEIKPYKSAIGDSIISVLSSKTADELSTSTGKENAKNQIKEKINEVLKETEKSVLEVSFGQFIIQ